MPKHSHTVNGLTPKQIRFCQEYVIDLNGTQAAIRAGYSEDAAHVIASENLIKPKLQEYIQVLQERKAERLDMDADYVINGFKEIYQTSSQKVEVKAGDKLVKKMLDPIGANKALENIGKHLGLFTQKVDVTSGGDKLEVNIVLPKDE